jgi:hypothetical protein
VVRQPGLAGGLRVEQVMDAGFAMAGRPESVVRALFLIR